ncbi:MAG: hypothetical protein ACPGU4_09425 [Flavobacteriales bacterium]
MKNSLIVLASIFAFVLVGGNSFAQETSSLPASVSVRTMQGVALGTVMCEDASGKMAACSGTIEETILGIVTNTPYITLNKPSEKGASRFIFDSFVSADAGKIEKGDYLVAGTDGNFVRTEKANLAYAMALDNVDSGQKTIRVKVLSKK